MELLEFEILTGPQAGTVRHFPLVDLILIGCSTQATLELKGDQTLIDFHCGIAIEDGRPVLRARPGQRFLFAGQFLDYLALEASQLVTVGLTLLGINLYRGSRLPQERELEAWFAECKAPIWVLLSRDRDRALLAWLARLPETASWPGYIFEDSPLLLISLPKSPILWTLFSRQSQVTYWASEASIEVLAAQMKKWIVAEPNQAVLHDAEALHSFLDGLSSASRKVFLGPTATTAGWGFRFDC